MNPELEQLLMDYQNDLQQLETIKKLDPALLFQPNEKQKLVLNSNFKEDWIIGGNRSGKTEINIQVARKMIDGTHPKKWYKPRGDGSPIALWLCSEDSDTQRDVLQTKFDRVFAKSWIKKHYKIRGIYEYSELSVNTKLYGQQDFLINWKTYNSDDDAFEGASIDGVICDEEPPESKYYAIQARLFDAGAWGNGYFQCAMSPVKGEGWTITNIFDNVKQGKRTDILVVEMSTYDNAVNLGGAERVKDLESKLPVHERAARIYGHAFTKEGKVCNEFKDAFYPKGNLVVPFKPDWSYMMPMESIDWGFAVPTSVGFYCIDKDGTIFKYDEIYVRQLTIPEIKGLIFKKRCQYGYAKPFMTLIDPSVRITESTGVSKLEQFASPERNVWVGSGNMSASEATMVNLRQRLVNGTITHAEFDREREKYYSRDGYISYPIFTTPAINSRKEGWEVLNDALAFDRATMKPKLFISSNCTETRREMLRLKWKAQKNGTASPSGEVSGDDHACDETRYLVMQKQPYVKDWNSRGKKQYVKL